MAKPMRSLLVMFGIQSPIVLSLRGRSRNRGDEVRDVCHAIESIADARTGVLTQAGILSTQGRSKEIQYPSPAPESLRSSLLLARPAVAQVEGLMPVLTTPAPGKVR